jgi:CBS domain-containing protein
VGLDAARSRFRSESDRHVPVEDDEGHLVGLVTHGDLLRLVARGSEKGETVVRDIMFSDPVTASLETRTLEAIRKMREVGVGCLPVVDRGRR